ncbi:conserved exported protein of unknown function（Protein of unknown function DUF4237,63-150&|uniref:TNT domain-containing protein n=1 Tax=Magnetospirillum sp. XM-1 TaxID=1663591 RepID=UPI00073DD83E|nr:TNT domain-containing protein [Magnetospirillum sp. XM-1]CUW38193.1 conserved exported protein of unknown function\
MRIRSLLTAAALAVFGLSLPAGPARAECRDVDVRPDISSRWKDGQGNLRWPTHEWSTEITVTVILTPGMVIDRFGCDKGKQFNPQGTAYASRALPYVCSAAPYSSYRVVKPLVAWSGRAAPWFDQKGGAPQFRTSVTAAELVADGTLERVEAGRPSCG